MKFKMPTITTRGAVKGGLNVIAPNFMAGIIHNYMEGKTTKEIVEWFKDTDIWDIVPPQQQQFLINMKPFDLEWLSREWVIETIAQRDMGAAAAIITSPMLQKKIDSNIAGIKEKLK